MTDTISFTCSACGHSADFPKAQEGKAIYCPKCQAAQVVKAPGTGTDRFRAERIPTGRIVKAEAAPSTDAYAIPHGMAGTARIDFTCGACNHISRISAALSGQPVRCPTCGTVQLAGVTGLRVVRLDGLGKLPFTCTSCNYQARLNAEYSGKAIRCPKCQGAQVVPRILRDPSGAHPALPSGASVVRSEPGTGSVKRPATGSFGKTSVRSEPSSALRTPAGGIPVAQPMPIPTPLPGSLRGAFATPPPGSITAIPEPTSSASAMALPVVPTDDKDDHLDLGDVTETPARPKGGVVRRSGRMNVQRTPQPGDEPTLEAARAVQMEPDPEREAETRSLSPQTPAPAVPRTPAPAEPKLAVPVRSAPAASSHPAWLIPAFGVAAAVLVIVAAILVWQLSEASSTATTQQQRGDRAEKSLESANIEIQSLKQKVVETEAARTLISSDRDDLRTDLDALRREHEQLKAETERLKAELTAAKAAVPKPVVPASVPANGQPAGK